MSCGWIAANSPPEDLMCICILPETVGKRTSVDITNALGKGLLALKGELSCDITSISDVTGADRPATWYVSLGVAV